MKYIALALAAGLVLMAPGSRASEEAKYLYKDVPDVRICLSTSDTVSLQAFCAQEPTMISLTYSQCAGICYPFIYRLRDLVSGVGDPGRDYRVLILSFDARDTPQSMAAMAAMAGLQDRPGWVFGTIDSGRIRRLTDSFGFTFVADSITGQLDHLPILAGIDRKGRIVSITKEFEFTRRDLWQLYRDIQGEYVPIARGAGTTLVSCFTYDPRRGSVRFAWGMVVLYLPVLFAGVIVWRVFRRRR